MPSEAKNLGIHFSSKTVALRGAEKEDFRRIWSSISVKHDSVQIP